LSYNIILAFILQLIILRRTLLLLYLCGSRDNDLFADWSGLVHMPVYSIDRKTRLFEGNIFRLYDYHARSYQINKIFYTKSAAKSITKDSIKLRIMAYEANSNILI
jgi:hypothetical protein